MPKAIEMLEHRIQDIVSRAAEEIAVAVRRQIGEEVRRLAGEIVSSTMDGRGAAARTPGAAPKAKPAARRPSGRRGAASPELMDAVARLISAKPGLRTEQIRGEIKAPGPEVKAALAKLREGGRVKTRGQRRATSYYPA